VRSLPLLLLPPPVLFAGALAAQAVEEVTVRFDNDILALRGTGPPPDHDYSHGLHVSLGFCSADGARWAAGIGQRIYTPRIDGPEPVAGERPYAAWLFASAAREHLGPVRRRSVAVELGVTGPAALGEPVQNGFHRLMGSTRQEGWRNQLGFEPGISVRYDDVARRRVDPVVLEYGWGATAGNVRTGAHLGAAAELARASGQGAFAASSVQQAWVARDLFLDGNTFGDDSPVEKLPFVRRAEVAAGYRAHRWAVEYRFTSRSREYRTQPDGHAFGSLTFTARR
jgi:lipid A 3-O-deacylase